MGVMAIIVLVTLLCVVTMLLMMNIPKKSSSEQDNICDNGDKRLDEQVFENKNEKDIEKG